MERAVAAEQAAKRGVCLWLHSAPVYGGGCAVYGGGYDAGTFGGLCAVNGGTMLLFMAGGHAAIYGGYAAIYGSHRNRTLAARR
eukprot:2655073-Rhodomonas_salina.1